MYTVYYFNRSGLVSSIQREARMPEEARFLIEQEMHVKVLSVEKAG